MPKRTSPTSAFLGRTGDGWALLTRDGAVVYEAHGPSARIECLRRARELGALRLGHRD